MITSNPSPPAISASIRRGLEQAIAHAEGVADETAYEVHIPTKLGVRAIRNRLKMTQMGLAASFGFNINTPRHWEQRWRVPEGPARAYLLVIDREL